MKFPVLWLSFVSELAKVIYLAWGLGSCSYITLHFGAKAGEKKIPTVNYQAQRHTQDFIWEVPDCALS